MSSHTPDSEPTTQPIPHRRRYRAIEFLAVSAALAAPHDGRAILAVIGAYLAIRLISVAIDALSIFLRMRTAVAIVRLAGGVRLKAIVELFKISGE